MKNILETLISHVQTFLRWLIDLGLQPDLAKLHAFQGQESSWTALLQSYTNQRTWLDHLSLMLELFIKSSDELKEHTKVLSESSAGLAGQGENKEKPLEKIPEE